MKSVKINVLNFDFNYINVAALIDIIEIVVIKTQKMLFRSVRLPLDESST